MAPTIEQRPLGTLTFVEDNAGNSARSKRIVRGILAGIVLVGGSVWTLGGGGE